jgi:LuxR family maltose regulon positive regulatory protein
MLQKAQELGRRCSYKLVMALVTELQARLWVAQGNLAAASRWVQEQRLESNATLDSAQEIEQMTVARVLIAQGKPDQAARLSTWLLEEAQSAGRMGSAIQILALQALAFQAQDDIDQALAALERALSLAEPEGYVRTFIDEGEPMARLLRQALSQDIAPHYVARLLAAAGQETGPGSSAMEALIEPLSEREMDVLRLIVAGLSNPEIAEELVIAVSTVKSHINHIYGKLGVSNRTRAVVRAQELGLV